MDNLGAILRQADAAQRVFHYSAVNAGKTASLLQTDHNYRERGKNAIIFIPSIDTRYGEGIVRSRTGIQETAVSCSEDFNFFCHLKKALAQGKNISCVLVDEASQIFLRSTELYVFAAKKQL